jgi:anti-anti-sigma factor
MSPDPSDPSTQPGEPPQAGTIEVGLGAPDLSFVNLHGEHDVRTAAHVSRALERAAAYPDVLVDLSDCSFIDSGVIKTLLKTAHVLRARGGELTLVIPPQQAHVTRVASLTGLAGFLDLQTSRDAALVSITSRRAVGEMPIDTRS